MPQLTKINIQLLNLFIIIVDSGGFTNACRQLNMRHSSISKKMSELEAVLGLTLCSRGRAGFSLTPDGEKVYSAARRLMLSAVMFLDDIDSIHNVINGKVKFATVDCLVTNEKCLLHKAIYDFGRIYSSASIDTEIMDSTTIERRLLERSLDLGITSPETFLDGLEYHYLFDEVQHVYCAPNHPALSLNPSSSLCEIREHSIVERGLAHNVTPLSMSEHASVASSTPYMEATVHMILSGYNLGYLPEHYANIWTKKGMLKKVNLPDSYTYTSKFYLTHGKKDMLSRAAKNFLDILLINHNNLEK